jgi:hypothetical protein
VAVRVSDGERRRDSAAPSICNGKEAEFQKNAEQMQGSPSVQTRFLRPTSRGEVMKRRERARHPHRPQTLQTLQRAWSGNP